MGYTFKIAVIILAYITVSVIGAYLIKLMLRRYEDEIETGGLKSAGMAIGMIERICEIQRRTGKWLSTI